MYLDDAFRLKVGLAEMLKGGVIMDVTNAEQAVIAEKAGATAVMALERVPADIRKEGGVARMAPISKIREIMQTVSIPVMAKARIGHFTEARILEALEVDYIDESEVLTPADEEHHIDKRDLQGAVRVRRAQSGRGAAPDRRRRGHDPHQGRSGIGQHRRSGAPHPHHREGDEAAHRAGQGRAGARIEEAQALRWSWCNGWPSMASCRCPNFSAGGIATPADAALVMQLGAEAVFVGSGIFKSSDPEARARAIVKAATYYNDPAKLLEASEELGIGMPGLDISKLHESRAAADPGLVDGGSGRKKVGVLALQGDFEAHAKALERAGADPVEVRSAEELRGPGRPDHSRRREHAPC